MILKKVLLSVFLAILSAFAGFGLVSASPYGEGIYGSCTYGDTCSISVSTSGTVSISISPTPSSVTSIAGDTVTVTTNNTGGYNLELETNTGTNTQLDGPLVDIPTSSGTPGSPTTLAVNTWGFRVDSVSGFGAGPTSAVTNANSSSLTFAGLPVENSPTTVHSSSSAAPAGEDTSVWYGARVDTQLPSASYSQTVRYTAVTIP